MYRKLKEKLIKEFWRKVEASSCVSVSVKLIIYLH